VIFLNITELNAYSVILKQLPPALTAFQVGFFRQCSFELADVVAHILKTSIIIDVFKIIITYNYNYYNDWNGSLSVAQCHCYPST